MKTALKILVGIAAAAILVVVGMGAGWLFWGRRLWSPMMGGFGLSWGNAPCEGGDLGWGRLAGGRGYGMMAEGAGWDTFQGGCQVGGTNSTPATGAVERSAGSPRTARGSAGAG